MAEMYSDFASVYDELMDNIPYDDWTLYLKGLLSENGVNTGLVAELGCGTGNVTRRLKNAGYDMIGIDNSEDMLDVARQKDCSTLSNIEPVGDGEVSDNTQDDAKQILYLCQDMREFELYGTVAAVVSICDSINYILEDEELCQVFRLVNNYLDPGGVFIFDFNTRHYYMDVMGETTIAEDRDDISFIWDNYYDEETDINELALSLFMLADEEKRLYQKHEELHLQRGYTLDCIKRLIALSGITFVAAYDAFTHNAPDEDSERIYIVAKEHGKQEKENE
jgi:SAM-dependent methyltransferase